MPFFSGIQVIVGTISAMFWIARFRFSAGTDMKKIISSLNSGQVLKKTHNAVIYVNFKSVWSPAISGHAVQVWRLTKFNLPLHLNSLLSKRNMTSQYQCKPQDLQSFVFWPDKDKVKIFAIFIQNVKRHHTANTPTVEHLAKKCRIFRQPKSLWLRSTQDCSLTWNECP